MICKSLLGEKLHIISSCLYTHKDGYFFVVINEKDEVFTLDKEEIKQPIPKHKTNNKIPYTNKTPKFTDYEHES